MDNMGLCITPDFYPVPQELSELKAPYFRSILYKLEDIQELLSLKTPLIITLNNQCKEVGFDWAGWDSTVLDLCLYIHENSLHGMFPVLCAGNELDIWLERGDRKLTPEFAADLARRMARIAHNYGLKVAATSVASSIWTNYFADLADLCRDAVDYFDIHPYGQRPTGFDKPGWMHGDMESVINYVQYYGQRETIVTETGVKIKDAGNEEKVAEYMQAANQTLSNLGVTYQCWFAYSDAVGAHDEQGDEAFGLVAADGRYRPAYSMFSEINAEVILPESWIGKVGTGLLEMMRADGTEPAQRSSTWLPLGVTPSDVEECYGKNGTRYYWLLHEDKGFRARPN